MMNWYLLIKYCLRNYTIKLYYKRLLNIQYYEIVSQTYHKINYLPNFILMFGINGLVVICNLAKKISDNLKIAISLYSKKCVKSGAKNSNQFIL